MLSILHTSVRITTKSCFDRTLQISRFLSFSTTRRNKDLKEAPDHNNNQLSTSFTEKAKSGAKTGGYGLVVLAGFGIFAVVAGTVLKVRLCSNNTC